MEKIILFDGYCNLCDHTVQWLIKHDKKEVFQFASLQGITGERIKEQQRLVDIDSVVLLENNRIYTESTAALRIARYLNGAWKLLYVFILIPKPLRNIVYRFIAKRRYKWFGKKESCMLPTPTLKKRFLD